MLNLLGTGTPDTWCVTMGADGVTKELLLIPQPGYADTAIVYFLRSSESLTLINNSDVPIFPSEYHGSYLVNQAMSMLTAMDATYDGQVGATYAKKAALAYRRMMHRHSMNQPVFNPRHWPGHGTL